MGVYIKGLKMPKDCFSCTLKEEGFCNLTNAYASSTNKINSDCPLVEVPEPHGRLIDGDEFVRIWRGAKICGDVKSLVDVRPTVIEAEGE